MYKNTCIAIAVAGVLVLSASVAVRPAHAQSLDSLQTQLQQLLAKVADLRNQLNLLKAQESSSGNATSGVSISYRHRICSILYRNISQGVSGEDVKSLQEFLRDQGYFSGNVTGYYGPVTGGALARWQASQGLDAAGVVGPLTRERIKKWCGEGGGGGDIPGVCTKEYIPVCGSKQVQCITTPCNPIQQTYSNRCLLTSDGATFLHTGVCGNSANKPPVISSFAGPTVLAVNETGTWKVVASDPENQSLSYFVAWGDEYELTNNSAVPATSFIQATTFTHVYAEGGRYTVTIVVRDVAGNEARTTSSVSVAGSVVCTLEYSPVCGQPPEPACRTTPPYCMLPTPSPQTYANKCLMSGAGATLLYEGECRDEAYACTTDAYQCPDGSYVGRTGPNCEFVCANSY